MSDDQAKAAQLGYYVMCVYEGYHVAHCFEFFRDRRHKA